WLELKISDSRGRIILETPDSPPPVAGSEPTKSPDRHEYGVVGLDRFGKPVGIDDFYTMVAPIYSREIPAGEGEVVRYRFTVPHGTGGAIHVSARLRAMSREATQPSTSVTQAAVQHPPDAA